VKLSFARYSHEIVISVSVITGFYCMSNLHFCKLSEFEFLMVTSNNFISYINFQARFFLYGIFIRIIIIFLKNEYFS
jgi:hypothetical protein